MTNLVFPTSMEDVQAAVERDFVPTGDEKTDGVLRFMLLEGGVTAMTAHMSGVAAKRRYWSLQHMVIEEGEVFRPQPFPSLWDRGRPRHCFENAMQLAVKHNDLVYCEGYGWSGILTTMHAWCVDADGGVVDPTWDHPEDNVYVGIRIPWHELFRRIEMVGNQQPIIDDWRKDYQWLHKGWKLSDHGR